MSTLTASESALPPPALQGKPAAPVVPVNTELLQEPPLKRRGSDRSEKPSPKLFHHRGNLYNRIKAFAHNKHNKVPTLNRRPSSARNRGSSRTSTSSYELAEEEEATVQNERHAIKVRLVTWNMYDSLPSGDLTDLLGEIEQCRPRRASASASVGTGARSSIATNGSDSIISIPLPSDLRHFPLLPGHPYHLIVVAGQEVPTASGVLSGKMPRKWDGLGWTSILEDWLCGGPEEEDNSSESDTDDEEPDKTRLEEKLPSRGTGDAESTAGSRKRKTRERGPYVLVEKERLMGIYLAVFCNRGSGCDAFIRGTSKSRVTAGLLRGRLGNKGGVAISLSFAGSRLLFISAHLAAHASNIDIRKANIKKIMEELVIDDFSESDLSGLPLAERFDQVFFMGDLNMRLDITRLHADFLLKSPAGYVTALEFDQLRPVLADPQCSLHQFREGLITFAPTYKYDVQKIKRKPSNLNSTKRVSRDIKTTEISTVSDAGGLAPPKEKDEDAASVNSSRASISSACDVGRGDVSPAINLPSLPDSTVEAVRRAQVRFLTLVRANSTSAILKQRPALSEHTPLASPSKLGQASSPTGSIEPSRPVLRSIHSEQVVSKSAYSIHDESDDSDDDRPVPSFDTSSKQRVQSYTDRILFRSNVGYGPDQSSAPQPAVGLVKSLQNVAVPFPSLPPAVTGNAPRHSYFDARPALDHPSKKITDSKTSQPWSDVASVSGEPGHYRFANFFRRRGLASRSSDSLRETSTANPRLKRAKSLSSSSDSAKLFWRRISVTSIPMIRSPSGSDVPGTAPVSTAPTTPMDISPTPSEPANVVSEPPPPHSPTNTADHHLPRQSSSFFRTSTLTRSATRASGAAPSRFRSFFHFLPFPFLSTPRQVSEDVAIAAPVIKTGPRNGEIVVLKYNAVADLARMGAMSDHRPVYAVVAIGIEDE